MLEVFGNVMDMVTMAVGAIAGISLFVGAIGILTMMWIAVGERTVEIGLVRAFGASRGQVATLFLAEAAALALVGGVAGLAVGLGCSAACAGPFPGFRSRRRSSSWRRRSARASARGSSRACSRRAAPRASIRSRRCDRSERRPGAAEDQRPSSFTRSTRSPAKEPTKSSLPTWSPTVPAPRGGPPPT